MVFALKNIILLVKSLSLKEKKTLDFFFLLDTCHGFA